MKNIVLSLFLAIFAFAGIANAKNIEKLYFYDLNGKKVSVESFKGKPTVLVFWQVYCHGCKRELPEVSKLAKEYKDKVRFYAVVINTRDILTIEERKREWEFDLPVLISDYKTMVSFRVVGTPTTIVLDKNLKIKARFMGAGKVKALKKVLDRLIKRK